MHSEYNPSGKDPVHFLQIWIQPDKPGAKPAYAERNFASASTGQLNLVASKSGREGSIRINQDTDLWLAKFGNGESVTHELGRNRHAWIHVAAGDVSLNGKLLAAGDGVAVSQESKLELGGRGEAQVLLFNLN